MSLSPGNFFDQAGAALAVTVPVFGLIALGWGLRRRGWLKPEAQRFITGFVYWLSLPILIFLGIAKQPFSQLISWPIISATVGGVILIILVMGLVSLLPVIPARYRAALVAGSFWANVTYMGFPLADGAWPDAGLGYAGIVNAFAMPTFVVVGTILLVLGQRWGGQRAETTDGADEGAGVSLARQLRVAVCNPIVIAAASGLLMAWFIDQMAWRPSEAEPRPLPPTVDSVLHIILRFAGMLGSVGLPLALLSVGAALDLGKLKGDLLPLCTGALGKLVVAPLLALGIIDWGFSAVSVPERGVAVLLMGTPTAVGCFVIAAQLRLAEHFVSALLVLSTLLSCLSLSIWLLFLL